MNSSAIMRPELISEAADKFGSQCVVVAIDAKRREDGSGWNIFKNGGRVDMKMDAVEWAMRAEKLGAGERREAERRLAAPHRFCVTPRTVSQTSGQG